MPSILDTIKLRRDANLVQELHDDANAALKAKSLEAIRLEQSYLAAARWFNKTHQSDWRKWADGKEMGR